MDTGVSRDCPGAAITVLEPCGTSRVRKVLRLVGTNCGYALGVHNNTLVNALRAVRERVFAVERDGELKPPPRPAKGVFASRLADFRLALLDAVGPCTPWSLDRFVQSYRGSKLIRYQRAVASLRARRITRGDSHLQAFVKAEAVNFTAKPDPAPRIIQPRNPRYNALVGRFIRPLEHRVYHGIAKLFGGPTVMKGYNALTTASCLRDMWREFTHPVALSLDASRFDQHVSREALGWEHSVYNRVYHDPELAKLLKWQLVNTGYVRTSDGARFRYVVEGCRMSGDMNTALGNCLIMCAMVWAWARHQGVRVRLANNGDDCSVIMEKQDLARFVEGMDQWFLEMGFTLTSEGVTDVFERIDFCQTRPVFTGRGWVMCRSPRVGLCKDVLCKQPTLDRPISGYRRWLYQVGTAGGAVADGVPVFSPAYRAFRRIGIPCDRAQGFGDMSSGFEFMARGLEDRSTPITPEARLSFWRAWGITPDQQVALEHHYDGLVPPLECWAVKTVADNPGLHFFQDSFLP